MKTPEEFEVTDADVREAAVQTLKDVKTAFDLDKYVANCNMMISKNLDRVQQTRARLRHSVVGSQERADLQDALDGWMRWVRRWRMWLKEAEDFDISENVD